MEVGIFEKSRRLRIARVSLDMHSLLELVFPRLRHGSPEEELPPESNGRSGSAFVLACSARLVRTGHGVV